MTELTAAQPFWRRFATRAALLLGLGVVASQVLPLVPREQTLVLRVGAEPRVERVSLTYAREGEHEPLGGATLRPPAASPGSVRHDVSLPNGSYLVTIAVERRAADGGTRETSTERRVTLQGGEVVLPVEDSP
jgi:hypothetical protein